MTFGRAASRIFPATVLGLTLVSCSGSPSGSTVLTADVPLHLEDHLDAATIEGSEIPTDVPEALEWRFDEPQPEWKSVGYAESTPVRVTRLDDALRVDITEANYYTAATGVRPHDGWIYVDLPDLRLEDWGYVSVRARAQPGVSFLGLNFNLTDRSDPSQTPASGFAPAGGWPLRYWGGQADLITDGLVHTYLLRVGPEVDWDEPWKQLGLRIFAGSQPGRVPTSIDILSVSLIPREAAYADADVGVAHALSGNIQRRELYTHTPARLEYRVRVPAGGRFDVGLQVVRDDVPVHFAVAVRPPGGDAVTLLEETYSGSDWAQRSLDLSRFEGEAVSLVLTATSDRVGTVALWVAPTLSGARNTRKPNIILYVIDSAGADFMSVYGYNRRTTPYIERLAAEGAVFEHAYSNSTFTNPSTRSFMTSLHDSVLGGTGGGGLPERAVTIAQHMRAGGYQTAMFTSNPNAGSATDRGVDMYRDVYAGVNSASSVDLQRNYWTWRRASPGEPYWVHFQTTDVHAPFHPVAPFAGLFIGPDRRETYYRWISQLRSAGGTSDLGNYDAAGVSRAAFAHAEQRLYDETMAHNDYQIGRLVERLKAEGEWENTLLIIGADHSIDAAMDDMGVAIQDTLPPRWSYPMLRPSISRVPLIVVWPGHIAAGQRFSEPVVSMIDVLPTIHDLVGLPMPEVMQGQSLAPLLLGEEGWEPRPVIFDEFYADETTGELSGHIEMIDGRWGASLEINPEPPDEEEGEEDGWWRRPVPLLLYDVWNDPLALTLVNDAHPELVTKYTDLLQEQWEAHRLLAQRFTPGSTVELTPEQLETLRTLGYIQ